MYPIRNNISVPSSHQDSIVDDCLLVTEKSQQWYNILEIIQKTIKKPNEKVEWKIKTIEFIANPELQLCFQSKLRELRTGCNDDQLEAQCVFTKEDKLDADSIKHNGITCVPHKHSNEQFADPTKGAHVYLHLDILLDWCSYKKFKSPIYIVMYKTVFGRMQYIDLNTSTDQNNNINCTSDNDKNIHDPIHGIDSFFIDENLKFDCKFEQYYPSMAYLYDMKLNGQLNTRIRQLLPYAILTCEILANDYYLHVYIEQQLKFKTKQTNDSSFKKSFYQTIAKHYTIKKSDQDDKNKKNSKIKLKRLKSKNTTITTSIDQKKICINIDDVTLIKPYKPIKTSNKPVFSHIPASILSSSSSTAVESVSSNTNILGLTINNNIQPPSISKNNCLKSINSLLTTVSSIKNFPLIEAECRNGANESTSSTHISNSNTQINRTSEDSFALIEKIRLKINRHKQNTLYTNLIKDKLRSIEYYNENCEENYSINRLDERITFLPNMQVQTSIVSERNLLEKLAELNAEATKTSGNRRREFTSNATHSNSSICIRPAVPAVQPTRNSLIVNNTTSINTTTTTTTITNSFAATTTSTPTAPSLQKLNSIDFATENLDRDLLIFDFGQNCEDANNLLLDKDFVNSMSMMMKDMPDIDTNIVTTATSSLTSIVNNSWPTTTNTVPTAVPSLMMQENTQFEYRICKLNLHNESDKEINSSLLIDKSINDVPTTNDVNMSINCELIDQPDPRIDRLIEKFCKSLGKILKEFLDLEPQLSRENDYYNPQQQQSHYNQYLNDIQIFCDKCKEELVLIKNLQIFKLIDCIKLIDINIDYLHVDKYKNINLLIKSNNKNHDGEGDGDIIKKVSLKQDQMSKHLSYTCYIMELKIHLYQYLNHYCSELLSDKIKALLHVKKVVFDCANLANNGYDPRLEKDLIKNLLFMQTFHVILKYQDINKGLQMTKEYSKSLNAISSIECGTASVETDNANRMANSEIMQIEEIGKNVSDENNNQVETNNGNQGSSEIGLSNDINKDDNTSVFMSIDDIDDYNDENSDNVELEINQMLDVLNEIDNKKTELIKSYENNNNINKFIDAFKKNDEKILSTDEMLKFNIKPFKINPSSLLAEHLKNRKLEEENKKLKEKERVRSQSLSSCTKTLETTPKGSKVLLRANSETAAAINKYKSSVNDFRKIFRKQKEKSKLIDVLDAINERQEETVEGEKIVYSSAGECSDTNSSSSSSSSSDDDDDDDSKYTTIKQTSERRRSFDGNKTSSNNNNDKAKNIKQKSRSRSKSRKRSRSRSNYKRNRSLSRSRSRSKVQRRSNSNDRSRNRQTKRNSRYRSNSIENRRRKSNDKSKRELFSRTRSRSRNLSRERSMSRDRRNNKSRWSRSRYDSRARSSSRESYRKKRDGYSNAKKNNNNNKKSRKKSLKRFNKEISKNKSNKSIKSSSSTSSGNFRRSSDRTLPDTPRLEKSKSSTPSSTSSSSYSAKSCNSSLLKQIFNNKNSSQNDKRLKLIELDKNKNNINKSLNSSIESFDINDWKNSQILNSTVASTFEDDATASMNLQNEQNDINAYASNVNANIQYFNNSQFIYPTQQAPIPYDNFNYSYVNDANTNRFYYNPEPFAHNLNRIFRFANAPNLPSYFMFLNSQITNDYYQAPQQVYNQFNMHPKQSSSYTYRQYNNNNNNIIVNNRDFMTFSNRRALPYPNTSSTIITPIEQPSIEPPKTDLNK